MRVLTPIEVRELEDALPSPGFNDVLAADVLPPQDLIRRGYVRYWRDDTAEYWETSPRGQLALRCHRAYLASVGGAG